MGHSISATDPEELTAVAGRLLYGGRIRPAGRGIGFSGHWAGERVGAATLGRTGFGTPVTMVFGELDGSYGVSLPTLGRLQIDLGGSELTATPQAAAVIGPVDGLRATGWSTPDDHVSHVRFEHAALEGELSRMLGGADVGAIRFPALLDLRTGRGAEWSHLARMLFRTLDESDTLAGNALFSSQLSSALMTGLLLATEHQYREALDAPSRPAPPALVRRAAQFIDDHAQQPITVPDVAAAVGASVRTLARGFRDHLGTSPSAYLARARLDGAHRDLAAGHPATTSVSQVAADWGFFNLGRFASRYRDAFGVLPSHSLRAGS